MPTSTVYAASLQTGTVATPANALGAIDGVFTTDNTNASWTARFALDNNPTGTEGAQSISLRVRHSGQSTQPTAAVNIYDGAGAVVGALPATTITSATSQDLVVNFTNTPANTHYQVEIVTTVGGGSPSNRASVQLDAITGTITYTSSAVTGTATSPLPALTQAASGTKTDPSGLGILYQSAATPAYGTTSVAPGHPASIAAGNYLVILVGNKPSTVTPSTPAGWSLIGTHSGGAGTFGADTGPTRVTAFGKVAAGGESGTVSITLSANDTAWAQMFRFSNDTGAWSTWASGGVDPVSSTVWNANDIASTAGALAAGDMCIVGTAIPTDAVVDFTGMEIRDFNESTGQPGNQPGGITLDAAVEISEPETALGNDISGQTFYQKVATGSLTDTVITVMGYTSVSSNTTGPSLIVRLREESSGSTGTAASTLPALTQAAAGSRTAPSFSGTATSPLAALTQAAAGAHLPPVYSGPGASTLPTLSQSATGAHTAPATTGTAASTIPALTQAMAGDVAGPTTGTAASTAPALTLAAAGTSSAPPSSGTYPSSATYPGAALFPGGGSAVTGSATSSAPSLAQAAAGSRTVPAFTATATSPLPNMAQAAAGAHLPPVYSGPGASTLPTLSQSATGAHTAPSTSGSAASALPTLTQAAEGARTVPSFTGTVASQLPNMAQAAAGAHLPPVYSGAGASTLPALSQAADGDTVTPSNPGGIASQLPTLTQAAAGSRTVPSFTGTVASQLPNMAQAAAGAHLPPVYSGPGASTLPTLSQSATGAHTAPSNPGGIISQLPSLTQAAAGSRTVPSFTATATSQLPALGTAATGTYTQPGVSGPLASTLPALTVDVVGGFDSGTFSGSITATLPSLAQAGAGILGVVGACSSGLPALGTTMTGFYATVLAPDIPPRRPLTGNNPHFGLDGQPPGLGLTGQHRFTLRGKDT